MPEEGGFVDGVTPETDTEMPHYVVIRCLSVVEVAALGTRNILSVRAIVLMTTVSSITAKSVFAMGKNVVQSESINC